jgi:hypothetical protein
MPIKTYIQENNLLKPFKMKKSQFVLAVMLSFSVAASAQQKWITKPLDGRLSVKFPSEPEKVTRNGVEVFTSKEKDSVVYSAGAMDMNVVAKMDSAALASVKDDPTFAEQLVSGIASQRPNYKFEAIKIGKWNTFTTYNVSGVENTNKYTVYLQMIFIGSKLYTLICRVPTELTSKKNELFFNSATLSK